MKMSLSGEKKRENRAKKGRVRNEDKKKLMQLRRELKITKQTEVN